jgi:glycosyltransferase involved in cell wall biosynthesis
MQLIENITKSQLMDSSWITVLVLTKNESIHIRRCLQSAFHLTPYVYVIDSQSTDNTHEIALSLGASVISVNDMNFAQKLNWTFDNVSFPTPWVLRLDADEVFTDKLLRDLHGKVQFLNPDVSGIYLRRQLWFMGKWIRYGGMYPTYSMRLWKSGAIFCEQRELDEHMLLRSGVSAYLELDIIDNPLTSLSSWIEKHNIYSTREAKSELNLMACADLLLKPNLYGSWAERRRWLKVKIFYRMPIFIRPVVYFFYRYFFLMGILDGRIGLIFHFMHGLWYRLLVDSKLVEFKLLNKFGLNGVKD